MSSGRKIGGIIALILGFLLVFLPISWIILYPGLYNLINVIVNIVIAVLVLLGAVMSLGNKQGGGILILVMAIVMILLSVLYELAILGAEFLPLSAIFVFSGGAVAIPYITLESIILILAGILVMASPE